MHAIMAGEAAALLDELMGKSRNVIPGKEVHEVEWWDSEVHIWAFAPFLCHHAVLSLRCAKVTCVGSVRVTSSQTLEQILVCHMNVTMYCRDINVCPCTYNRDL